MSSDPNNPFLEVAVQSVAPPPQDNLVSSLEFIATRILTASDPMLAYSQDLIRAAAASPGAEVREVSRRLKLRFGKDFSVNQWNADVRDARAALVAAGPTGMIQSESGGIKPNLANAVIQLRQSIDVSYDLFSSRVIINKPTPWGTEGPWRDIDDVAASNHLQHQSVNVSSATANEAALLLAYQNQVHPLRDWLTELKWDGEPRLDSWMADYLGADNDEYTQNVAAKWMISAVARAIRPGCKADYMIVLEGPQRLGKSRALRALTNGHLDGESGAQWFRDALPDIDKDDIGLYMQGVWIIEVAELEAIRGKQWTKVKAFISSQTDTFRRKFGRNMQDYPRQCIFAASTNEYHWGGDPTGLTRFWPVRAEKIDVDGIMKMRDQLWAEARHRYDEGETWWLSSDVEKLARAVQAERAPDDAWTDRVHEIIKYEDSVSIKQIMEGLNVATERQDHMTTARVSKALAILGWERYRAGTDGRPWRYRKPIGTETQQVMEYDA